MRDAMEATSGGGDGREEDWRLRERLHYLESSHRLLERQNQALQRRVAQLEAQSGQETHHRQLAEHDSNVRGLLRIIRHHEAAQIELQRELERLQAKEVAAVNASVKVSRSAQTECCFGQRYEEESHGQEDASAYLQHLYQQLQLSSQGRSSQTNAARHNAFVRKPPSDFRSSVMKRLKESRDLSLYPASIPEEGEEGQYTSNLKVVKSPALSSSQPQNPPPGCLSHLVSLEEQNQQLRERLDSQQTLLDQLLNIKLDNATNSFKHEKETPTSDQDKLSAPAQIIPLPSTMANDSKDKRERSGVSRSSVHIVSTLPPASSRPMSPPAA